MADGQRLGGVGPSRAVIALLPAAVGLGLAGLDPAGALVAVAALAAGAQRRTVLGFGFVVVAGSSALGVALSLTLGVRLRSMDLLGLLPGGGLAAAVEAGLGTGLLGWAWWRRRPRGEVNQRRGRAGLVAMLGLGLAYAALSLVDPTFAGMVVLAGRGQPVTEVTAAHVVWSATSQLPLTVLLIAVAMRAHDGAVAWFRRTWTRVAPVLRQTATGLLVVVGLLLLGDAGLFGLTGRFVVG